MVSAKIPGRIQTLTVDEGQDVKAGQLIAMIESDDLQAARKAAEATAASQKWKLGETVETELQDRGETGNATVNAEAQVRAARASLAQAQANYDHQQADTSRTVALAKQGIMSEQARDDAATSLQAAKAAVETARENVAAAEASLRQARAHELLATVAGRTVDETRNQLQNARALADQRWPARERRESALCALGRRCGRPPTAASAPVRTSAVGTMSASTSALRPGSSIRSAAARAWSGSVRTSAAAMPASTCSLCPGASTPPAATKAISADLRRARDRCQPARRRRRSVPALSPQRRISARRRPEPPQGRCWPER